MSQLILIVSGPSGVGKSTLLRELSSSEFYFSVSYTTREPREGEVHGKDYYFVDRATFREMLRRGELLEWVEVHGNYYGTAKSEMEKALSQGKHLVLDIEVMGASALKKYFGPSAITIFIAPPNLETLKERLKKRGTESEEKIKERLRRAHFELSFSPFFDYLVVNEDLSKAKEEFLSIIKAELCRPWRIKSFIHE